MAAPQTASAKELHRNRYPSSTPTRMKRRSRPVRTTSRAACQGSAGVREPPANTARLDVSSSRPDGCPGSSGIETGALK